MPVELTRTQLRQSAFEATNVALRRAGVCTPTDAYHLFRIWCELLGGPARVTRRQRRG